MSSVRVLSVAYFKCERSGAGVAANLIHSGRVSVRVSVSTVTMIDRPACPVCNALMALDQPEGAA